MTVVFNICILLDVSSFYTSLEMFAIRKDNK